MLNGINLNDELANTAAEKQLNSVSNVMTNPINNPYKNIDKSLLIDETAISDTAIQMYQKEQDVTSFNALALSNPEDLSHEELMAGAFEKGAIDPFSDEMTESLSGNEKLLNDLDLNVEM